MAALPAQVAPQTIMDRAPQHRMAVEAAAVTTTSPLIRRMEEEEEQGAISAEAEAEAAASMTTPVTEEPAGSAEAEAEEPTLQVAPAALVETVGSAVVVVEVAARQMLSIRERRLVAAVASVAATAGLATKVPAEEELRWAVRCSSARAQAHRLSIPRSMLEASPLAAAVSVR
jgi:hypothetical protein